MAQTAALGPQNAGAQGGVIPFWAAAQNVIWDQFTSDSFTPGSAVANLFQGSLADLKSYGFFKSLYLAVTSSGGTAGSGNWNADAPMNFLSVFRVIDPNGHAIIDADS